MQFHRLAITALAATSLLAVGASAQSSNPQPISGAFRGMLVCEKLPTSPDILRVPFDLKVDGGTVQYARPIFNWNGQQVLGSEMGNGTLGSDGKIHLTAAWSIRGISYRTEYNGTLTATGGTLTGTQSWQGGRGTGSGNVGGSSRTCNAAVVPAPQG